MLRRREKKSTLKSNSVHNNNNACVCLSESRCLHWKYIWPRRGICCNKQCHPFLKQALDAHCWCYVILPDAHTRYIMTRTQHQSPFPRLPHPHPQQTNTHTDTNTHMHARMHTHTHAHTLMPCRCMVGKLWHNQVKSAYFNRPSKRQFNRLLKAH